MPKNPYKLISPQAGRHSEVCEICLRMVLTLMILPGIPIIDSPVIVSLPSQIPLKNLGSIFGSVLVVEIMYCIVSAISHSGAL